VAEKRDRLFFYAMLVVSTVMTALILAAVL
jgi:hypothetical protein